MLAQKGVELSGHKPFFVSMSGYINGITGNRQQALAAMTELQSTSSYTLPLFLARIHTALGEKNEAMNLLEKLYEERSESIVWLKVDPTLAALRDEPRFIALAKRIGI